LLTNNLLVLVNLISRKFSIRTPQIR